MSITTTIPLLSEPVANDLDSATFGVRARANFLEVNPILSAINVMVAQLNAESASINSQSSGAAAARTAAEAAAAAAAVSASAAAATSTAANWVSGTTYAVGNVRRSLIDGMPYRRLTAGAGTIDPRDDATNWALDYLQYDTGLPTIRPSLLLDFANSGVVDPRITVTRAGVASYWDARGVLQWAPANTIRITHDPVTGERLGVLIEGASTNLAKWSEDVSNVAWTKANATVTADAAVAPDGTTSMDKLVEDSATGQHQANSSSCAISNGVPVTASVYLKAGERTLAALSLAAAAYWVGGANKSAHFDLSAGSVTLVSSDATAGIENVGGGIYRCWLSSTPVSDGSTNLVVLLRNASGGINYAGDGASGLFVWGAQVETGVTRPTSYIKTTIAAVTRAAEVPVMTGSPVSSAYNPQQFTLLVDAVYLQSPAVSRYAVSLYIGAGNFFGIFQYSTAIGVNSLVSGVQKTAYSGNVNVGVRSVSAAAFSAGSFKVCNNGGVIGTETAAQLTGVVGLALGAAYPGSQPSPALLIRRVCIYPAALSDGQIKQVTRI